MTPRGAVSRRRRPDQTGHDLVRILTKLTRDVERFDSVVLRQRRLLEHLAGHVSDLDTSQLHLHSERISLEAAEMVACARQALEQLSVLAEPTPSFSLSEALRVRPRREPKSGRLD
jgi:phage shock protein A